MPNTANDHAALIGRLPEDRRRRILDRIAALDRKQVVAVEHSYFRKLDGHATTLVGRIIGVAFHTGGGSSTVLLVEPVDPRLLIHAIPAAHVLRVRMATKEPGTRVPDRYRLGEVLAGPPPQDPTALHYAYVSTAL